MAYAKMTKEIETQTKAMIQGITEIIPDDALSILNDKDLGSRLAGIPKIDSNHYNVYILKIKILNS